MNRTNRICLRRARSRFVAIDDNRWMPLFCGLGAILVGMLGLLAYVATGVWSHTHADFGMWLNFVIVISIILISAIDSLASYCQSNGHDAHQQRILVRTFYNNELDYQKSKRRPLQSCNGDYY